MESFGVAGGQVQADLALGTSVMFCDFSRQVTQEECKTILSLVPARCGETSPDLLQGSHL